MTLGGLREVRGWIGHLPQTGGTRDAPWKVGGGGGARYVTPGLTYDVESAGEAEDEFTTGRMELENQNANR